MQEWTVLFSSFFPGVPVAKGRPRLGRGGRVYTPKKTSEYERDLGWHIKAEWHEPTDNVSRYSVRLIFHLGGRADVDNLAKSFLDGLNGVVWTDDSQVDHLEVSKQPVDPGVGPGVWYMVMRLQDQED